MKKTIITFLFTLLGIAVFSQQQADSLALKKVFGGYKVTQNGNAVNLSQLQNIVRDNPEAYSEVNSVKSKQGLLTVMGLLGGGAIGYTLGTAAGGGEPQWTIAGVGAGLIALAIPISIKSNKQLKHAVELYNAGLSTSYSQPQRCELQFAFGGTCAGVRLRF